MPIAGESQLNLEANRHTQLNSEDICTCMCSVISGRTGHLLFPSTLEVLLFSFLHSAGSYVDGQCEQLTQFYAGLSCPT